MNFKKLVMPLIILVVFTAGLVSEKKPEIIRIGIRESRIVNVASITKVAIGDPELADLTIVSKNELLVNGTKTGITTLHIWTERDIHSFYLHIVNRVDILKERLSGIEGLKEFEVTTDGDAVLIKGFCDTQETKDRVSNLAEIYFSEVLNYMLLPGQEPIPDMKEIEDSISRDGVELVTKLFAPISRKANDLKNILDSMLSADGKIIIDDSTNTMIVMDIAQNVRSIGNFIQRLDEQSQTQVMIEAKFIELTTAASEEIGMNFSDVTLSNVRGSQIKHTGSLDPSVTGATGGITIGFEALTGKWKGLRLSNLNATISALQKEGKLDVLSSPRVTTINNKTAKIDIKTTEAYISGYNYTYDSNGNIVGGSPILDTFDYGITLEVTPTIGKDNVITLQALPTVRVKKDLVSAGPAGFPVQLPLIDERTTEVEVMIPDGGTLIIGGLTKNETSRGIDKVPFLGDMPLLGNLFKRKRQSEDKTNLAVFITVRLIRYDEDIVKEVGRETLVNYDNTIKSLDETF